jgi:hypothetical protein
MHLAGRGMMPLSANDAARTASVGTVRSVSRSRLPRRAKTAWLGRMTRSLDGASTTA